MNISQSEGVINGCVEVINPHPELSHVLVCAGRGQQQALVSQLWQELFRYVSWSQTSIKITSTPSTIRPVSGREKVPFSLFSALEVKANSYNSG